MTTCPVCRLASVFDVHPCCADTPPPWPQYALNEATHRVRRCPDCHGKGWRLPTDTRPPCARCATKGHIPWPR